MLREILDFSENKPFVRIRYIDKKKFSEKSSKYMSVDFHYHDETEIIYVASGILAVNTLDEPKRYLRKGDAVVINGSVIHSTVSNTEEACYYILQFSLERFLDMLNTFGNFNAVFSVDDCAFLNNDNEAGRLFTEIIFDIYSTYIQKEKGSREKIIGKICELIGILRNTDFIKAYDIDSDKSVESIESAISYINENYSERISPRDIAEHVNLNQDYLGRIFKKQTGKTLMEYVNHTRLNEAKKMLVVKNKNITDIAIEAGFSSTSYFVRAFKAANSITPGEYRSVKYTRDDSGVL